MPKETDWYVITGGPNCGKTPVIEALALKGFSIRPEAASVLINQGFSEGKTLEEIRADEIAFQNIVLEMKIIAERKADPRQLIFWDRGMPDSITYFRINGESIIKAEEESLVRRYKGIFILDLLPNYARDHRRVEDESKRRKIHDTLISDYQKLGYNPLIIPVIPINARVEFILKNL